jgi:outer membrane protein OmpA-like peptidoglycan-associated protein
MKHLKIAILALLMIASYSNSNAQDKENPWMFTFATNAIDISTNSDTDSGYFGSFNYDGNDVKILPWISKVSVARYLDKGFSLELAGSYNKVDRPWGTGADVTFAAVDLNVKYDLNNVLGQTGWFNPFIYVGAGENWVGTKDGISVNVGGGFNAWISDHVGINVTSGYKKVNTPIDFEMFQHSIGLTWKFGKSDTDKDGIRDKDDACPNVFGLAEFNGCPDTDADDDGVKDCCDKCPDVAGLAEFGGCPDTDGDGIPDVKDKCPEVAGVKELHGCPDADGDGVTDKDDACPNVPGPKTNAGCPFKDTDGDGVIDLIDNCVEVPGPAENHGCPEIFKDESTVNAAAKGINFDTGKSDIRKDAAAILDQVASVLNQNENLKFNFSVNGHTDNTGSAAKNMELSTARANAVKAYLVSKGVSANRLSTKGFGQTSPIDTNATKEGRFNNRRVEIKEIK